MECLAFVLVILLTVHKYCTENARRLWMSHYRGRRKDNILGNAKLETEDVLFSSKNIK
jgi:hypothetical protein